MTDDFSDELAEIAKFVSRYPSGLSELRELINSLPAPSPLHTPPTTETQLPTTEEQTQGLSSGPVSAAGVASENVNNPASISGGAIIPGTLQANAFASSVRPIQMVDGPDVPPLPDANFPEGAVIFNQDDGRFYRNEAGVWHTFVPETGLANTLPDPAFETVWGGFGFTTLGGYNGRWHVKQEIVSGTPGPGYFDDVYSRGSSQDNPFNSEICELDSGSSTGAYDQTNWVWSAQNSRMGTYASNLPYVVAAIQFIDWGPWSAADSDYTEVEAILQIYSLRAYGAYAEPTYALVVEAETRVDVKTLPADVPVQAWVACYRDPTGEQYYGIRFGLRAKKNATASSSGWVIAVGEPQLHLSGTPDPAAFTPAIGTWYPNTVVGYYGGSTADMTPRFQTDQFGAIKWQAANEQYHDLVLSRAGTKVLQLDSYYPIYDDATLQVKGRVKADYGIYGATAGGEEAFYVGDDAILADVDQADTLMVKGQQDATKGAIILGNNKDVRLFRDGYRTLHVDANDGWFTRLTGALAGWCRQAHPTGFSAASNYTTPYALDAGASSVVFIEVQVPAKMMLKSVSIWNTDTSGTRGFQWGIYAQPWGNESNDLSLLCFSVTGTSWTAGSGALRTANIDGAPVFLPPGTYWLAIWNNQAANTLGIGSVATGTLALTRARKKTTISFAAQPVNFLTATWTDSTSIFGVVLNGEAAPSASQIVFLPLAESLPAAYAPEITHKVRTITLPLVATPFPSAIAFAPIIEHAG